MGKGHKGKNAVITGGATGIGQAYVKRLTEEGVNVAILDISDASETMALVENEQTSVKSYVCDVSSPDDIEETAKTVLADFGNVDILINNAGIYPQQPFLEFSFAEHLFKNKKK